MTQRISITLQPRAEPLAAEGLAARGVAAFRVVKRLIEQPERRAGLAAVAAGAWIVVLGEAERLPYAEGVIWLGREPHAPALYVPTRTELAPSALLVSRALREAHPDSALPLALLPEPLRAITLADACTPDEEALRRWLAQYGEVDS